MSLIHQNSQVITACAIFAKPYKFGLENNMNHKNSMPSVQGYNLHI